MEEKWNDRRFVTCKKAGKRSSSLRRVSVDGTDEEDTKVQGIFFLMERRRGKDFSEAGRKEYIEILG